MKEELTMYALHLHLCLLEEGGLVPVLLFFIIKVYLTQSSGQNCLPACISYKHPILINLLLA